jgi:exodeoxyribonuclease V beta subunit
MIDEFQDTDELQWKIFGRVWAESEATSLTIVGDPKQAIYSFRGADVHTYLAAKRALEARGALTMALDENWRSSPDIVAAINALIDGTYGTFFTGDIRYDAPVRAASTIANFDGSPVHVFEIAQVPGKDKKLDSATITDTIAQSFADEIARLLGSGAALRPADIHVLTRSGAHSDAIARAVRARGVPCALYQREHLFESDEALEVADLLAAIADPRDRSARLRAWTTSFFAVPLAGLEALTEVPDGHPLLALLHDWRGLGLRKDWDGLFHRILEDTRWIERTLIAGGGERAVTNVLHVFELLHDELAGSPAELHELAARVRAWIDKGGVDRPDDLDIQRLETERQAVQIMTIHRAKGLEAPVVFVCGGHGAPPGDETRTYHDDRGTRWMHIGKACGDAMERIERDEIEENQRLMYVAITRAKQRLYLTRIHDFKVTERAPVAALHASVIGALAARATDPESARLFASSRVTAGSLAPPPPVEEAADLAGWTPPPAPAETADPAWDEIRHGRGGMIVTSYSKLKHAAARASEPGDVRGEEHSSAVVLDPADLPPGSESGLFLHEVLEHVPFESARDDGDWQSWAARPEVAPVLEVAARRHGIGEAHRRAGARVLHASLVHPIEVGGRVLGTLAGAPRVAREVEFTYPLELAGGREAFARGYVDLLVGWDERLWVVDYKSDVIAAQTAAEARPHALRHYRQQSQLYTVAAARLLGLAGEDDFRRRFGGVLFWFLRSNYVVDLPVRWADVATWTRELARDVAAAHEEVLR